jgi:hypothetical protein
MFKNKDIEINETEKEDYIDCEDELIKMILNMKQI